MNSLKDIRKKKKLTQQQVSDMVGISVRSYKAYENEDSKVGTLKYDYILKRLMDLNPINEEHGVLTVDDIKETCRKVLSGYPVNYCFLFGSYAKGHAVGNSDVDLLISSDLKGLKFYGMVESLRENLNKKVDVLDFEQLRNNPELTNEILKYGIKIYG